MLFLQITLATAQFHVLWCQGKGEKKIFEKFSNFKVCNPKNQKNGATPIKFLTNFHFL